MGGGWRDRGKVRKGGVRTFFLQFQHVPVNGNARTESGF